MFGAATDMLTGGTPCKIAPRGNVSERKRENTRLLIIYRLTFHKNSLTPILVNNLSIAI
jgi:hypothetical protein